MKITPIVSENFKAFDPMDEIYELLFDNNKALIIDGDSIPFKASYGCRSVNHAIEKVDTILKNIFSHTGVNNYVIILKSSENYFNYRKIIEPTYKKTRNKDAPKFHDDVKKYIINNYNCYIINGAESDDVYASLMVNFKEISNLQPIGVSIDKDLLIVPGYHYNYDKKTYVDIQDPMGDITHDVKTNKVKSWGKLRLYQMLLQGDAADNVKGIQGIGQIRSFHILRRVKNDNNSCFQIVKSYYTRNKEGILGFIKSYLILSLNTFIDISDVKIIKYRNTYND